MDETRIQCNKEDGKLSSSESLMWVMRSAASEKFQAAFFYYSRSRSGDNARKLLDGYKGFLITDAFVGYDKVPDVKRALCWSHLRRCLIDSIPLDAKGKESPGSKGPKEKNTLIFSLKSKMRLKISRMKKKTEASEKRRSQSLIPFGRG